MSDGQQTSNAVSMSPELADKAHTLMCEIVGAWNTGSIVTHEVRGAVRQWLIDVADFEQHPLYVKPDDEHAWLIESKMNSARPIWWNGVPEGSGPSFTPDNLLAIRFSRKEDAERVAQHMAMAKVTEHMWCSRPTNPPPVVGPNEGPIVEGLVVVPDGYLPPFYSVWKCSQCGKTPDAIAQLKTPCSCGRVPTPTKGGE